MRLVAKHTLISLIVVVGVFGFVSQAGEADDLRQLAEQWLKVREQVAATEADWEHEKSTLDGEAALVAGRRAALEKELAEAKAEAASAETEAKAAHARFEQVHGQLLQLLAPAQTAAQTLRERLPRTPEALRPQLREQLAALPDTVTVGDLADAVPALFDAFNLLMDADRTLRVERELLAVPGEAEREMEVLYIGRGIGLAVSLDDRTAAVGRPRGKGFEWQWQPELAASIRQAVTIYKREAPAALVKLPLTIDGGDR